ncbi:carcinoembryonic antigen-related cell adhesion molecule 5-like, partial [Mercenaria mercenaria]|uniref:carcinoembryonic antigen-related cell adhesion molecule 5-like n=1 Tax=Mercenaria mercenaria TaxID=6596 RepID=UPI00234FA786
MEVKGSQQDKIVTLSVGDRIRVEGWPCVSPIGRVYSQINTDSVLQFTADLTNLNSPRRFVVKFYDDTIQAVIRYNTDRSSLNLDAQPGVSITGDTTGNVVVTLFDVVQSNAGTYTMDSTGVPLRCNCLYILGTPTKPSITLNKVPSTGESATLKCSSTSTTTPSNHSLGLSYNWTVDNKDNPSGSRYSYSTNRNTLTLSNVVKDDANKLFTCTATEVVSGGYISSRSESFSFDVHYGPENIDFSPSDTSYERAESTYFNPVTCTASCNPPCSFMWTKIGQAGIIGNTAVLSLGRLAISEAGTYRCTATRSGRSTQTKDFTVNVIYGPYQSSTHLSPSTQDYIHNEKTTLQDIICSADCYPGCTYTWTKTRQGKTTTVSSTGVLSLGALDPDDAATYICTAENPGKSSSPKTTKQVTVKVRYGPNTANINVRSPYYTTEGDTNIHIECSADCYPACSYAWTNLTSGSRTSVNDILSFGTVDRYMTGDYKCTSSNAAAEYTRSSEANITIIVR